MFCPYSSNVNPHRPITCFRKLPRMSASRSRRRIDSPEADSDRKWQEESENSGISPSAWKSTPALSPSVSAPMHIPSVSVSPGWTVYVKIPRVKASPTSPSRLELTAVLGAVPEPEWYDEVCAGTSHRLCEHEQLSRSGLRQHRRFRPMVGFETTSPYMSCVQSKTSVTRQTHLGGVRGLPF